MSMAFSYDFASPRDWAEMYRSKGIQVVPGHAPRAGFNWKRPQLAEWKDFQEELVSDIVFERWFGPIAPPNMGVLTGRASGNIFVIDLDLYKTPSAMEWWRGVLAVHNHGFEPETWQQTTGGGGKQLFFRAPPDWVAPTNRTPIGVDVRGQGGFAILPPSMHESRKEYVWIPGLSPWEIEIEVAEPWLLEAVEKLVAEHGGSTHQERAERTPGPGGDYDAFGTRHDGREEAMRDLVWAAVQELRKQCPLKPLDTTKEMWAAYENYERRNKSRLPGDRREGLEREGRGLTEFQKKWRYALDQWDTKVAEKADIKPDILSSELPNDPGPFRASAFSGSPPERKWIVQEWIAEGVVNSLYGAGGVGKTLLAQQLAYCLATARPFLGIAVDQKRVFCVLCEDDRDEIHRRHEALRNGLGNVIGNPYEDVWLWPRVGYDNILVTWDKNGIPQIAAPFEQVLEVVLRERPDLLILDTLADFFGGNEIVRAQVNHFIKTILGRLILKAKESGFTLTVLLLAHPSTAGMNSGTGTSGSTAWENAVRARLYMRRPESGHPDERELIRAKANYANSGEETTLRLLYQSGVFLPESNDHTALEKAKQTARELVHEAFTSGDGYVSKSGHRRNLFGAGVRDLCQRGVDNSIAVQVLRELVDDGEIELSKNHRRRGYRLSSVRDDE